MNLQEEYKERWYYDETSPTCLRWGYTPSASTLKAKKGDPAGYSKNNNYYYLLHFKGKELLLHRVVWTILNGEIPQGMQINHINADPKDNRISNLEVVTPPENYRRMSCHIGKKLKKRNKSGYNGVRYRVKRKSVEIVAQFAHESNKVQEISFCFVRWSFDSFVEKLDEAITWRNQKIKECISKGLGYPIEASEQFLDLKAAEEQFEYLKELYLSKYGELHETRKTW